MDEEATLTLRVTRAELELVRTALKLLLSTLGREEAEELKEVQTLLATTESLATT
jgi:hypothetical protein